MAEEWIWHPPKNWPRPPRGWQPPPGWEPPADWPEPSPDHVWWSHVERPALGWALGPIPWFVTVTVGLWLVALSVAPVMALRELPQGHVPHATVIRLVVVGVASALTTTFPGLLIGYRKMWRFLPVAGGLGTAALLFWVASAYIVTPDPTGTNDNAAGIVCVFVAAPLFAVVSALLLLGAAPGALLRRLRTASGLTGPADERAV